MHGNQIQRDKRDKRDMWFIIRGVTLQSKTLEHVCVFVVCALAISLSPHISACFYTWVSVCVCMDECTLCIFNICAMVIIQKSLIKLNLFSTQQFKNPHTHRELHQQNNPINKVKWSSLVSTTMVNNNVFACYFKRLSWKFSAYFQRQKNRRKVAYEKHTDTHYTRLTVLLL